MVSEPDIASITTSQLTRAFNARHIPKLDALRAISALLVMFSHFGAPVPGCLGVTCFFVISGFLITRLLLDEYDKTGALSLRNFYLRRAFRIFPAFYCSWFLVCGLTLKHHQPRWGPAISSLFYVGNYYPGILVSPFARTWSLGVEEQFYLLWPLLFLRMSDQSSRLLKLLAGIVATVWVLRVVLLAAGVSPAYLMVAFECRADALLVGCAIAIALRREICPRLWRGLCRSRWNLVLSVAVLCASFSLYRFGSGYVVTVAQLIEPLLCGAILVQLLGIEWPALNWMDSGPVRFLGQISYSTYLYHGIPSAAPAALKVVSAYALATASYYGVEKPFLRLRERHGIKRAQRSPQPGPLGDSPSPVQHG